MRDLAVLAFVTLDGVMQAPSMPEEDLSGGFGHGGWAAPFWERVMPHVEKTAMAVPYDMLFGRMTYDIFAGHWPTAPRSPLADRLNAARKYVVTSEPQSLTWENAEAVTGDVPAALAQLKRQTGPLLQVHGSPMLIQMLLAHGLIDELRLWTFPVVVGDGKRLFDSGCGAQTFDLLAFDQVDGGVTMQTYRRAPEARVQ